MGAQKKQRAANLIAALSALILGQLAVAWLCPQLPRASRSLTARAAATPGSPESPWELLQRSADEVASLGPKAGSEDRLQQAAKLLVEASLREIRKFMKPTGKSLSQEASDGGDKALEALLGDQVRYVVDFLMDSERPGPVSKVFWQAELYLRGMEQVAGETPVEELTEQVQKDMPPGDKFQEAYQQSTLFARQQFAAAVRYGYFLRRARQRLRLETILKGTAAPANVEAYLQSMGTEQQVELVRAASDELAAAVDLRATELFGESRDLYTAAAQGAGSLTPLQLSAEGCLRLSVEAVGFGAALFDAEEEAAQYYSLSYSDFGDRSKV